MKINNRFVFKSLVVVGALVLGVHFVHSGLTFFDRVTGSSTSNGRVEAAAAANISNPNRLVSDMNAAIKANATSDVTVAASLVDPTTGQTYNAGATTTAFTGASTTKVLTAVDYLHQVELGKASLDQYIDGVPATTLLKNMIEVSDNDAWQALEDYLGAEQPYAASIGLNSFSGIYENVITASDEAKLLTKLYNGKLINAQHRALLYSYMANTDSHDMIPAALPSNAIIYHKYGELDGNLHDAAIVKYQGHVFILVIYTNNATTGTTDDYTSRLQLIRAITVAAFKDVS